MSEYFKRHPMKHEDRVGDLPVGYRNIERNEVDMLIYFQDFSESIHNFCSTYRFILVMEYIYVHVNMMQYV